MEKGKSASQSLSQRLHESLARLISNTQPGERLPSEPDLALQLGVSRATLREAMRTFETQGFIRRRQGSGTYVLRPSGIFETGLEVLESIETQARRIGLPVTFGELVADLCPAEADVAAALGIPVGKQVLQISRVILAEDRPVAFLVDILPEGVIDFDPTAKSFTGSVLDLLLRRENPKPSHSMTEIGAVDASADIAKRLNIQRGDALLRFVARLYDMDGRVMDYSYSYFLPGYFRFQVVRGLENVNV